MNKIWTIVKKELKRYFTDKRTLISLFLPGLLIFVLYTVMGNVITSTFSGDNHLYIVNIENMPDGYNDLYNDFTGKVNVSNNKNTKEESMNLLNNGSIDLYIEFDDDFNEKLANGDKPSVNVYYASSSTTSSTIYGYTLGKLSETAFIMTPVYYINMTPGVNYDVAPQTEDDSSRMFIQMMMPFLLVIFLFSGCMAISAEAIAGEKERGTIYTLLVTPTKRSEIAIGKILALSIVSLVSATASFAGTIVSLPKLMGGNIGSTLSIYSIGDYAAIFLVILMTVILFTSILLLISAYAKSIKESGQLALVVMIPTMLMGVASMLGTNEHFWASFIPIYNSITTMSSIFSGNINYLNFLLTIAFNIALVSAIIFLLTKMFNSEKIMRSN